MAIALSDPKTVRKSWLLAIGEAPGMTPLRLTTLAILLFIPASLYFDTPLVTAATAAYVFAITNYLVSKQQQELLALRPILDCSDASFQEIYASMRNHSRIALNLCWVVGALAMLAVNYNSPSFVALRQGALPAPELLWSWFVALFFWIAFTELLVITVANSRTIATVGADLAVIDLLDTGNLVPFARVGIRNILIFVGGYALLPIVYFDDGGFRLELLISLSVVVPISLALLVMPMNTIRDRIRKDKSLELYRIQKAMHGDRHALSESPISRDAQDIQFTGLILYRQMINEVNEWPIDYPVFIRLGLYIIIPLLTWFGAAIVERIVEILL